MTDHTRPDPEDRLRALLDDAVSDVEPRDALETIRNRTKVAPMTDSPISRRPWLWAGGGAALATAAVLTLVAYLGNPVAPTAEQDPGTTPTTPATADPTPGDTASGTPDPSPSGGTDGTDAPDSSGGTDGPTDTVRVAGVYYAGETPYGVRLFREFVEVTGADPLQASLDGMTREPSDPDYSTAWPEGSIASSAFDGVGADGLIQITLADESLHDRPAGMTEREAQIAVEQAIYTAQAAVGARAPVQFYLGENPINEVFGVPTSEPLSQGDVLETLSLVNISDPSEGLTVSGSFEATGVANSFEANVPLEIRKGSQVVWQGYATAGWDGPKLFPWKTNVPLKGLAPGEYTFVAMTDDPTGGAEGNGPYIDTRTIVVTAG